MTEEQTIAVELTAREMDALGSYMALGTIAFDALSDIEPTADKDEVGKAVLKMGHDLAVAGASPSMNRALTDTEAIVHGGGKLGLARAKFGDGEVEPELEARFQELSERSFAE